MSNGMKCGMAEIRSFRPVKKGGRCVNMYFVENGTRQRKTYINIVPQKR